MSNVMSTRVGILMMVACKQGYSIPCMIHDAAALCGTCAPCGLVPFRANKENDEYVNI